MASRKEEKERARAERIAAEQEAARASARRRTIGYVSGGVLGLAIVAAVAIAIAAGGGSTKAKPALAKQARLAAAAAGCQVNSYRNEGRTHVNPPAVVHYKTNPPTSGNHYPVPAHDGDYVGQGTPQIEYLVHALEHGRVEVQYKPGTPASETSQLEALVKESFEGHPAGYKILVFQNMTKMPSQVAVATWQHSLTCPSWNSKTMAAIRAYRDAYVDTAPENIIPFPE
jgi:hypothetical protein